MLTLRKTKKLCCCFNVQKIKLLTNASHLHHKTQNLEKILIANRGEIACRIIRSAKKCGMKTVAIYSETDKNALHIEMADEAYHIGPAPSTESYLNINKIIKVAEKSHCQAIHPGYGFLSENAEFSEICQSKGIVFVGPPAAAIRNMGIKNTSKVIMENAGVPVVKGYHGEDQSIMRLKSEAIKIGFPLMIKAVRGGGGKGMRISMTEADFLEQLESAKRESLKAFGDDSVLLEQYIIDPRHVEVQVFADMHDNVVHLFERDCSVQRRHQKIIEEAPAPGLSEQKRQELGAAAVRAARAVSYVGAGTVEFILDRRTHDFHFMEMNTRLQVEHPITEMITGTDLVEWQLRVARGEPLPLRQEEIPCAGHAVECRVYAEEPRAGFLPRSGVLRRLVQPTPRPNVRVESGVREGDEVSVHYDPMIAKLAVWGRDRRTALATARRELATYQVSGIETNVNFLIRLSSHESFLSGDVHTSFIAKHKDSLFPDSDNFLTEERAIQAALGHIILRSLKTKNSKNICLEQTSWRPNYKLKKTISLTYNKKDIKVTVIYLDRLDSYRVQVGNGDWKRVEAILSDEAGSTQLVTVIEDRRTKVKLLADRNCIHLYDENGQTVVELSSPNYLSSKESAQKNDNDSVSPTPGVLEKILVKEGDMVEKGQPLFVVIAMKMEYVVRASHSGRVMGVAQVAPGTAVKRGTKLLDISTS